MVTLVHDPKVNLRLVSQQQNNVTETTEN